MIKVVTETVKNEVKEQKGEFLGMLAAMLASNLMASMLLGKGVIWTGKGTNRGGKGFYCHFIL